MDRLPITEEFSWIREIKKDFEEFLYDLSRWYKMDERGHEEKEILFKEKLVEGLCELVDGYADVEGEMTNGQEWATIRVHGSKEKRPPVRFFLDLRWEQENFYGKLRNNIIIENEEDGSEKEYAFD